jgi:hypothetical protein
LSSSPRENPPGVAICRFCGKSAEQRDMVKPRNAPEIPYALHDQFPAVNDSPKWCSRCSVTIGAELRKKDGKRNRKKRPRVVSSVHDSPSSSGSSSEPPVQPQISPNDSSPAPSTEQPTAGDEHTAESNRPTTRRRCVQPAAATPEVNHTLSPACRHVSYLVSRWLLSTTTHCQHPHHQSVSLPSSARGPCALL